MCREIFGFVGVGLGLLVAAAGTAALSAALGAGEWLSPTAATAVVFAGLFLATVLAAHVLGAVADRLARALLLGGLNRAAGVVFGSLKAGAALGFGLLLAERLVPSAELERAIAGSRLARPLIALASGVLEAGRQLTVPRGQAV